MAFRCKHCGRGFKREKNLLNHESTCFSEQAPEGPIETDLATKDIFGITEDKKATQASNAAEEGGTGADQDKHEDEIKLEVDRLKIEFQRQKEEEKRLKSERLELQRERDAFFKTLAKDRNEMVDLMTDQLVNPLPVTNEPPEFSKLPGHGDIKGKDQTRADISADKERVQVRPDIAQPAQYGTEVDRGLQKPIAEQRPSKPAKLGEDLVSGAAVSGKAGILDEAIFEKLWTRLDSVYAERLNEIYGVLENIKAQLPKIDELFNSVKKRITQEEFQEESDAVRKDILKIENRVNEMGEEVGFGESLNVSKVPPNILINVYEATLADAIKALIHNIGPYDAESRILKILEDIRTQTSGSELFKFESGKLKISDLAKSLENKSISAKQVQSTYTEILNKIQEYIPGYKPKNFRAMLKLKSQEFAVDKTAQLSETLIEMRTELDLIKSIKSEIFERLEELEESRNSLMSDVRELEQKFNRSFSKSGDDAESDDSEDVSTDEPSAEN